MDTFTEWLRQQMRQRSLDCRQLADGAGLAVNQIKRAVDRDEPPSARAVQRLAAYFGADEEATVRLAAEQVAASEEEARTPQERRFVAALYRPTPAQRRVYSRELAARVQAARAEAQGAPGC